MLTVPMFERERAYSSNVLERTCLLFQCFRENVLTVPMFERENVLTVPMFERENVLTVPMFESENELTVPMFERERAYCSNV